jgi:hypothetical protein
MSLRPAIGAACRAALRDGDTSAARAHRSDCAFCADRAAARDALDPLLRRSPSPPSVLADPAFLQGVYERVVDSAEQGPLGRWVEDAPAPPAEAAPMLDEALGESALARSLMGPPRMPDAAAWSGVRDSVLEGVLAEAAPRRALGSRLPLAACIAAAAVLTAISLSDGTPDEPRIVFTELGKVPDVPFAVVRHGMRSGYR